MTGQDLGTDSEKWKSWWVDQIGYVYESEAPAVKPAYTLIVVTRPYIPLGLLRCRNFGPNNRRPTADRDDPDRRSAYCRRMPQAANLHFRQSR